MNINALKIRGALAINVTIAIAIPAMSFTNLAIASPLTLVSGPSPFPDDCGTAGFDINKNRFFYINAEVEPQVAVNPTNPNNIVGVWQQDRWTNSGSRGLVAGVSHDGGATWTRTFAHFSSCTGGTVNNGGNYDRASDPWVTIGPTGDVYQASLSTSADRKTSAILVSKSADGGYTWSEPTTLIKDTSTSPPLVFNDKESVTADPTNSSYVYAVWDRASLPSDGADFNAAHSLAYRGDIYFSRTTNSGQSWEQAHAIFGPNANLFTIGHQIVVLPDGTLVDVFNLSKGSGSQPLKAEKFFQAIIRSSDKGAIWSSPINISTEQAVPVVDPDNGASIRTGSGFPDIAVDSNNGNLYAVWEDGRFSNFDHNDIAFLTSTDGGLTWSGPVKINQTTNSAAAFSPAVQVAADGSIGVTYYDYRNNTPVSGLPTDYWLIRCQADCSNPANWAESHISGPFDIETAPNGRGGYFMGDYQGLINIDNDFLPFFVQTNSGNPSNITDVFSSFVGP